jgi:hypothetical protein
MTEPDLVEAYRIAQELADATQFVDISPTDPATGTLAQALKIFAGTLHAAPPKCFDYLKQNERAE